MTEDIDEARAALHAIPALARHAATAGITRLGGLTNRVFRVAASEGTWCLRLAGKGTEEYINRSHEAETAALAAEAGVAPALVHADPTSGLMVTRYVDGAVTMTPDLFATRAGAAPRAGAALAHLHGSGAVFPFRFELFAMIDDYLRILSGKIVTLPEGYDAVLARAEAARAALSRHPAPLVPCHCDPLCENFLDTGQRMWIVDWEYAGMNEAMWDLGDLSVEAGFDAAQDTAMLTAYFGRDATPDERGRMVIYKAMCDLLWTLWGLIQFANNNPADDFWAYATGRFQRCRRLMATDAYAEGLVALD